MKSISWIRRPLDPGAASNWFHSGSYIEQEGEGRRVEAESEVLQNFLPSFKPCLTNIRYSHIDRPSFSISCVSSAMLPGISVGRRNSRALTSRRT